MKFATWNVNSLNMRLPGPGLRIDHILVSPALAARCAACNIDGNAPKGDRPSGHAPVIAELTQ